MFRNILIIAMIAVTGITGCAFAAQRITTSQVEQLQNKVEARRDAYLRIEQAEQEAKEEGSAEHVAVYKEAKAKAYEAYISLKAELEKTERAKQEQDKRLAEPKPAN